MSTIFHDVRGTSKQGLSMTREADRRRNLAATLRTKKKSEVLQQKRSKDSTDTAADNAWLNLQLDPAARSQYFTQLAQALYSGQCEQQHEAAKHIRKLLSAEHQPPIDNVINTNPAPVPQLVQFLGRDDNVALQFEAAWALTNIASGTSEHTCIVVKHGAVPAFIKLLSCHKEEVREQAVWALGNIAGDSAKLRDQVLGSGILQPLLTIIYSNPLPGTLRNATWTLSNLLRGKPTPDIEKVRMAFPALAYLVKHDDEDVLIDALWAVSYATDGTDDRIEAIVDLKVGERLVQLLHDESTKIPVMCPTLRTVGNIVTGTDEQTQEMIESGVLGCFARLLSSPDLKKSVRKECCWAISNITAGTEEQIQSVIAAGLLPLVIKSLEIAEIDVKKEAAWALANLIQGGNEAQIYTCVKAGCMKAMIALLNTCIDVKLKVSILEALQDILNLGDEIVDRDHVLVNEWKEEMKEHHGILHILESLQDQKSEAIDAIADDLIRNHFADDFDIHDPRSLYDMQPPTQPSSPFHEGIIAPAQAEPNFNF
eukprot:TRINITY_DN17833_c1_g2_i1.p1 TRINITY_DN17833_c1_g2~~TRINITY_DN17833_c1_g2_i1.p1  ORF type:complete len:540 (+),score=158.97 TRINITY_DN17833_c1_g2_i1:44-1663(+)